MSNDRRIPIAYFLNSFSAGGPREILRDHAQEIIPEEYEEDMKGYLFCPSCTYPLIRVPHKEEVTTSGKTPHFRHKKGYEEVVCSFRVTTAPGKKYTTQESVREAIEDGRLSVISQWLDNAPEIIDRQAGEFDEAQIIDNEGAETEIPLGKHDGQTFKVPSRISSVYSLCVNMAEKLTRYYYFPNSIYPVKLIDALVGLHEFDDDFVGKCNLYHGVMQSFVELNVRNIIKISTDSGTTIHLYTYPENDKRRRINKESVGSRIIVHGEIIKEKGQFRIWADRWGQYAKVTERANKILERLE